MDFPRIINLSKYKIDGYERDAEYEMFAFVHISGLDLGSCTYTSVMRIGENQW